MAGYYGRFDQRGGGYGGYETGAPDYHNGYHDGPPPPPPSRYRGDYRDAPHYSEGDMRVYDDRRRSHPGFQGGGRGRTSSRGRGQGRPSSSRSSYSQRRDEHPERYDRDPRRYYEPRGRERSPPPVRQGPVPSLSFHSAERCEIETHDCALTPVTKQSDNDFVTVSLGFLPTKDTDSVLRRETCALVDQWKSEQPVNRMSDGQSKLSIQFKLASKMGTILRYGSGSKEQETHNAITVLEIASHGMGPCLFLFSEEKGFSDKTRRFFEEDQSVLISKFSSLNGDADNPELDSYQLFLAPLPRIGKYGLRDTPGMLGYLVKDTDEFGNGAVIKMVHRLLKYEQICLAFHLNCLVKRARESRGVDPGDDHLPDLEELKAASRFLTKVLDPQNREISKHFRVCFFLDHEDEGLSPHILEGMKAKLTQEGSEFTVLDSMCGVPLDKVSPDLARETGAGRILCYPLTMRIFPEDDDDSHVDDNALDTLMECAKQVRDKTFDDIVFAKLTKRMKNLVEHTKEAALHKNGESLFERLVVESRRHFGVFVPSAHTNMVGRGGAAAGLTNGADATQGPIPGACPELQEPLHHLLTVLKDLPVASQVNLVHGFIQSAQGEAYHGSHWVSSSHQIGYGHPAPGHYPPPQQGDYGSSQQAFPPGTEPDQLYGYGYHYHQQQAPSQGASGFVPGGRLALEYNPAQAGAGNPSQSFLGASGTFEKIEPEDCEPDRIEAKLSWIFPSVSNKEHAGQSRAVVDSQEHAQLSVNVSNKDMRSLRMIPKNGTGMNCTSNKSRLEEIFQGNPATDFKHNGQVLNDMCIYQFYSVFKISNIVVGVGLGSKKKNAQQAAACSTLKLLGFKTLPLG